MKKSVIYAIWGALYCLCVGLGFVSATGMGRILLGLAGLAFFVPPFYLLWQARKEENRKTVMVLRLVSAAVLALSMILLVLNFLSVYFSAHAGLVLYVLLVMFTPPMACMQSWALSLFLWACLLMLTLQKQHPYQR